MATEQERRAAMIARIMDLEAKRKAFWDFEATVPREVRYVIYEADGVTLKPVHQMFELYRQASTELHLYAEDDMRFLLGLPGVTEYPPSPKGEYLRQSEKSPEADRVADELTAEAQKLGMYK